jgi:hypothetical protein
MSRVRLLAGVALLALVLPSQGYTQPLTRAVGTPGVVCHEDMPCWRCADMGNRICGSN